MEAHELTLALGGIWRDGRGVARCPVEGHGRGRGDKNPSLSISSGHTRSVVFHCHAGCSQRLVLSALKELSLWSLKDDEITRSSLRPVSYEPSVSSANTERAAKAWAAGQPIEHTAAERYLLGRSVGSSSVALRFASDQYHPTTGDIHPALLAAVRALNGDLLAVQRTFLSHDGTKAAVAKARLNLGCLGSGAVQLAPAEACLGLAEGLESALSAVALFDMPVWSTCGLRFDKVSLPTIVKRIVLFADNDPPGLEHARMAQEHFEVMGYEVSILAPDLPGADWNDVLRLRRAERSDV